MQHPVIASPQVTNHILHKFKLRADKKLGQNFLIDEDIVRRITKVGKKSVLPNICANFSTKISMCHGLAFSNVIFA